MADVVEFFLKMAEDDEDLVVFGLERGHIALVAEDARPILDAIRQSAEFADDAQAAQLALADAIVSNGHLDAEVQHVMAPLVVFLATQQAIFDGATRVGFVLTPGKVAPQLNFEFATA